MHIWIRCPDSFIFFFQFNFSTLKEILAALDDKLNNSDLDGIIAEIDTDGSGTVDFDGNFFSISSKIQFYNINLFSWQNSWRWWLEINWFCHCFNTCVRLKKITTKNHVNIQNTHKILTIFKSTINRTNYFLFSFIYWIKLFYFKKIF